MGEQEIWKIMGNQLNNKMPEKIRIVLKIGIHINKEGISSFLLGKIGNIVSFSNPQIFTKHRRRDFQHIEIPRWIMCG